MKKLFIALMLSLPLCIKPVCVYADEIPSGEVIAEGVETEQDLADKVSEFLGEYLNANVVADIVSWLMSSGVLAFALSLLVKVRKYKDMSGKEIVKEFEDKIGDYLKDNFNKLSDTEIAKITGALKSVEETQETLMKVLLLMQDSTTKGKVALLDYLGTKTHSESVKADAETLAEKLEEEIKVKEEVVEKIGEEYTEIF